MLAIVLALFSVRVERRGPEQVVYSNLCGPTTSDLCYKPVLKGGFPVGYLFDAAGVSREDQLAFVEDNFHRGAFAIDVAVLFAIVLAIGLLVRRVSSRSVVLAMCVATLAACGRDRDSARQSAPGDSARHAEVAAHCYRSPSSILFGPRTSRGQQGHPPGWLRIDGDVANADSGDAQIMDADANPLDARWRRASRDTIEVQRADDFLKVALRFTLSETMATGHATAYSDAAAERDSQGAMRDLQRAWVFTAVRAPCDSMSVIEKKER